MTKPVILTGLRANNDLHIGNYFGAMLPIIDMAKQRAGEFQVNMFIPDLHSFTTPINHDELQAQIMHNAMLFVAAGLPLDNADIHLYRQSYVPAHSELTWILDCFTGFGEMSRMTQFREKTGFTSQDNEVLSILEQISNQPKHVMKSHVANLRNILAHGEKESSMGLFNYPVLMASDILLYGASYIPVGDDQTQHLEFTRDIAERMNNRFGELFTVPERVKKQHEFFGKDQGLRVMDLVDPTKKMSKSSTSEKGVIFLGDDPEVAATKIMSATTDDKAQVQLDKDNQPGVTNLLEILALLRGQDKEDVAKEFTDMTRYGDFKKIVADEMKNFLTEFQAKLGSVEESKVIEKLEASEVAMNKQANVTLLKVQQAVGLRPRG